MNRDDDNLFSYNEVDYQSDGNSDSEDSFDLNSFSSVKREQTDKKQKSRATKKERVLKTVLTVFLVGIITFSIIASVFMVYVFTAVDATMDENLNNLALNFTTSIYVEDSDTDEWVEYQRLHGTFNRIWCSYNEELAKKGDASYDGIPQNLVNAFVAIEDKRFFSHQGVDWKRTAAAFVNMFLPNSKNYGGSTITQQLVKNLTGDNSRKPSRKIREIMRARYFEKNYSKPVIIECYLNTIPLGHGLYGVEVASNYYFNKNVNDLTVAECAILAAITQRPSYLAPDVNFDANKERKETVLYQMYKQGYLTKEEYDKAMEEKVTIHANEKVLNETEINSYFVDALITQVTNDLVEKYGYEKTHASKLFYTGGYKIYATLDADIQEKMESVFEDSKKYGLKSAKGQTLQGSMTIVDYKGNVKGMVGGIGEKTSNRGWNNATDSIRQPGSTMKPIAAYAPAIEQNLIHYSSIVNDKAINYNGWTPKNWYGGYWGNISVQYALERSVNTIPVYLVNKLSTKTSFDFLTTKLGITTLNSADMDLSPLGMGGTNGGITSIESAAAYAIFGNGGLYYEPTLYTKVLDQRDNVILDGTKDGQLVIGSDTATVMNHLLQTVVYGSNGTGKGARGYVPKMKIYAKTGTSNNSNDLWFVGGTPYYVGSVWCGYANQEEIRNSAIALNMWGSVMSKVHSGLKAKTFEDSDYAYKKYYCTSTGLLATDSCKSKAIGWYKKNNIPALCTTHKGDALPVPGSKEEKEQQENKKEEENNSSQTNSSSDPATTE